VSDITTGRAPRTNAEWVRQTEKRLKALESSRRLGDWTLTIKDGNLVAAHINGRIVVLAEEA